MARISFENASRALDANGDPVSGALKYTYLAGTTTIAGTFADLAETTAQSNPLTADAEGYFPATYVSAGSYKIRVTDASGNLIWEADNIAQEADESLTPIMLVAAGQSNIASTNAQSVGGDLTSDPRILLWNGAAWVEWTPSTGMGVGAAGRNSILFQAAKQAIRDGYPKVYCVVDGHAGQPISYWTASGAASAGYASLKTKMDGAIASSEVAADGITNIHAFIWGQGESDGGSGFTMSAYRSSFGTLKSQLRAESWFAQNTPIACLEMPTQPSAAIVNRFFVSELPFDADPYTSTVRTFGLDDGADNLHWTGAAINEIGLRAFEQLKVRVHHAMPYPYRIDADAVHFRLEEVFGAGLGIAYLDAPEQVVLGPTSDAQFPAQTNPTVTFDIDGMFLRFDHYTYAATTFEFLGGAVLKKYFGSNFADIGHAVNTDPNKKEGTFYMDSANDYLVVANGAGASATWSYFAPAGTYTPA